MWPTSSLDQSHISDVINPLVSSPAAEFNQQLQPMNASLSCQDCCLAAESSSSLRRLKLRRSSRQFDDGDLHCSGPEVPQVAAQVEPSEPSPRPTTSSSSSSGSSFFESVLTRLEGVWASSGLQPFNLNLLGEPSTLAALLKLCLLVLFVNLLLNLTNNFSAILIESLTFPAPAGNLNAKQANNGQV